MADPSCPYVEPFQENDLVAFIWSGRVLLYSAELAVGPSDLSRGIPDSGTIHVRLTALTSFHKPPFFRIIFRGREGRGWTTYSPQVTLQRKLLYLWSGGPDPDIHLFDPDWISTDFQPHISIYGLQGKSVVRIYQVNMAPNEKFLHHVWITPGINFRPPLRIHRRRNFEQSIGRKRTFHEMKENTLYRTKLGKERFSEQIMKGKDLREYYGYEDAPEESPDEDVEM